MIRHARPSAWARQFGISLVRTVASRCFMLSVLAVCILASGCASDIATKPDRALTAGPTEIALVGKRTLTLDELEMVEAMVLQRRLAPDAAHLRPLAFGALVGATLLEDEVKRRRLELDQDALRLETEAWMQAAQRGGTFAFDAATTATLRRIAERMALRAVAGPMLAAARRPVMEIADDSAGADAGTKSSMGAPAADGEALRNLKTEALIILTGHRDVTPAGQARMRKLGERLRQRRWRAGERFGGGRVAKRKSFRWQTAPLGLRAPLFSARAGTTLGPILTTEGWVFAQVLSAAQPARPWQEEEQEQPALSSDGLVGALDVVLWPAANITIIDRGLKRWLSAADLTPGGLPTWQHPCRRGEDDDLSSLAGAHPDPQRACEALRRFVERSHDAARFVAAPAATLGAGCDRGDLDACIAFGADRGLRGPRLSVLFHARQTQERQTQERQTQNGKSCRPTTWLCQRKGLLKPIANSPLSAAARTLTRLGRRCAIFDPASCHPFAALLEEMILSSKADVKRSSTTRGAKVSLPRDAPLRWMILRGCARTGSPVLCRRDLFTAPGPGGSGADEQGLKQDFEQCFAGGQAPQFADLRAAACLRFSEELRSDFSAPALARACQLGSQAACHRRATVLLARGDASAAAKQAARALKLGDDGVQGKEAAQSLRLLSAMTGCQAEQADDCQRAAGMVLEASDKAPVTLLALKEARSLLNKACQTSGTGCLQLGLLLSQPGWLLDAPAAETAFSRACRGGLVDGCLPARELTTHLRGCSAVQANGDARHDTCGSLATFYLPELERRSSARKQLLFAWQNARGSHRDNLRAVEQNHRAVEQNQEGGLDLYQRACRQGETKSCQLVVDFAFRGQGATNTKSDLERVQALCHYPAAQRVEGCGPLRALGPLTLACRRGNSAACRRAAEIVLDAGRLSARDRRQVDGWLELACQGGEVAACRALRKSPRPQALFAFYQARCQSEGEDAPAHCRALAILKRRAEVGPRDPEGALQLVQEACLARDRRACLIQGQMLRSGEAGRWDVEAGSRLVNKACREGLVAACREVW